MIKVMLIVIYVIMIFKSISTTNWAAFAGWLCALILILTIEVDKKEQT